MRGIRLAMCLAVIGAACEPKKDDPPTPTPTADPKKECLAAVDKLYAKMSECDLKVDDIPKSTFCDKGTPPENIRAMASQSCDAIIQQLTSQR